MTRAWLICLLTLAACGDDAGTTPVVSRLLESCETTNTGSWSLDRGYYTDSFPGRRLDSLRLYFSAEVAGDYTFRLTVRQSTYNGTVLGTDEATVTLVSNPDAFFPATFAFPDVALSRGSTVTLDVEQVAGAGGAPYTQADDGIPVCTFTQTADKTPPLSTDVGHHPRIAVYGLP